MRVKITIIILIVSFALASHVSGFEKPPVFAESFGSLNFADMYPVDIAVDDELNVYLIDNLNRRVQKRDENNNILLTFGERGTDLGSFLGPRGIALDSEGKIYVTDINNNRVQKFDIDGTFLHAWGETGNEEGQFSNPLGIAINPSGMIYIADKGNARIQVFDTDGNFLFEWGEDLILSSPQHIEIDSNSDVWVTDSSNKVIKYDQNGTYLTSFGEKGDLPGQFYSPTGITIDRNDFIYVYDRWNSRIQKFDATGNFVAMWGEYGDGDGQMNGLGLTSDGDSNIYIADYWNFRIQKFDSTGQFLYKWFGTVTGDEEFAFIRDLIINHSGDVYVLDHFSQKVQVFDDMGYFSFQWGSRGPRDWEGPFFNFPSAITNDSQDNVYISNNNDIRIFDKDGNYMSCWTVHQSGVHFSDAKGLAADNDDQIFFTTNANNVVKMSNSGEKLGEWGTTGAEDGQFHGPAGIDADSLGNIYVSDVLNRRIQKFTNDGDFLLHWGNYGIGNGQFVWPIGLAIDSEDHVYVVDQDKHQIQKFDSDGNFLTSWGTEGSDMGEFDNPLYVAVDDSGTNIYVTDQNNGRVQKFTYEPITLDLLPSLDIISRGSSLDVQLQITNNTSQEQSFTFYSNATLPDGNQYPAFPNWLYRSDIILAPYETATDQITHAIPSDAPLGGYIYHGYAAKGVSDILHDHEFTFSVIPPDEGD